MKTERITILATPGFKQFLTAEARRGGVSVGELVRSRCERPAAANPAEEAELIALTAELRQATKRARQALTTALAEAGAALAEMPRREKARPERAASRQRMAA